ncbi:MAG: DUF2630 family protein [Actinobacteria bacterium]|nr:MAG: DUF2630 family protein [Actinomycetota bacterium]
MDDKRVLEQINKLASEEKALWHKEEHEGVSDDDRQRLKELEVTLDQCWDLLHQRRAAREAGKDPREAKVRPVAEVEGYEG